MKKILITQSNLTIGGIQRVLVNLLNMLDYDKYQVDLVLYEKKGDLLSLIPSQVNVISIKEKYNLRLSKLKRLLIEFFGRAIYFKFLYKDLVNEKKYDIAIAFDGYVSFSDYYAAYANAGKKIIWIHSDYKNRSKFQPVFKLRLWSMHKKYKLFNKIVAVSKNAMNNFASIYPQYKDKLTYLWNLVDQNRIDKGTEERQLIKFDKNTFNIIAIGSIRPVKGFDRLILVQEKLKRNGYNTKLYIVGDGPDRFRIEKLITELRISDRVILTGQMANPYNLLKQADLFVISSRYEGFGLVLLESLYLGIPIVVPKISGAYEIAKNIAPKGSAIITENSIEGLYNGIVKYMNNKKNNFYFDLKKYNQEIIKKFEELL